MRKKIIVGCLLFMIIMLVGCSNTKSKVVKNEKLITDDEIYKHIRNFKIFHQKILKMLK